MVVANRIKSLLETPSIGLKVYVAAATNNLYSLNNDVIEKLAYADYVIFVNFCRKGEPFPGSIYSHQELAIALALGHKSMLLYTEVDAPKMGIMNFMVLNRPPFNTSDELLTQITEDVKQEEWSPTYSRFLRAKELATRQNVGFGDGVGNQLRGTSIGVVLENLSPDLQETVSITLETLDGKQQEYMFRSPHKVSGQRRYDAAIPPGSSLIFDLLMEGTCTTETRTGPIESVGVFLVSALDLAPLPPLFNDGNDHEFVFRVDARARRPTRFTLVREKGNYLLKS